MHCRECHRETWHSSRSGFVFKKNSCLWGPIRECGASSQSQGDNNSVSKILHGRCLIRTTVLASTGRTSEREICLQEGTSPKGSLSMQALRRSAPRKCFLLQAYYLFHENKTISGACSHQKPPSHAPEFSILSPAKRNQPLSKDCQLQP